jgi:hypothetical protein
MAVAANAEGRRKSVGLHSLRPTLAIRSIYFETDIYHHSHA